MENQNVVPFLFEGEGLVRVAMIENEPWFVAVDVCKILGLAQAASAVRGLDDDEKGVHNSHTLGGDQEVLVINESGLYALTFRSRKPEAKKLRKWVTSEVLPSIRKTGSYSVGQQPPAPDRTGVPLEERQVLLREVQEVRLIYGPEAAAEYWKQIGLPDVPAMNRPRPSRYDPPPGEIEWRPKTFADLPEDDRGVYAKGLELAEWVLGNLYLGQMNPKHRNAAINAFSRVRNPDSFAAWAMDYPSVYSRLLFERPDLVRALRSVGPDA